LSIDTPFENESERTSTMRRFTDREGTVWCVEVTDKAIADLQQYAKINLTALGLPSGEGIERGMTRDSATVVVSLLAISKGQRLQAGISQDEFGARVEQVHAAARDALLDALFDWASNTAVKARFRRAARAIRAEAARIVDEPKTEPKPTPPAEPAEPAKKQPEPKKS
jgi:hypothetical protein